jgi:hypothetical protein
MGTISDRWTSERHFPAADQSGTSSNAAWFPRMAAVDPFCEFFFLLLLVRSGLSILMDHPRLYWNRD